MKDSTRKHALDVEALRVESLVVDFRTQTDVRAGASGGIDPNG